MPFTFVFETEKRTVGRDVFGVNQWFLIAKCYFYMHATSSSSTISCICGHASSTLSTWRKLWQRQLIITKKVLKFGPHSVAPKIPEELKKQKSNKKGWILFCKRFQSASFMCEKKSLQPKVNGMLYFWHLIQILKKKNP